MDKLLDREQEEHLKKRMIAIMLCTNWVCAGTFVDHEWVSSRTIIQKEEEVLSMVLDFKIDRPCVVQWSLLWFPARTSLNQILGHELKIKKYHEVECYHVCYRATIWWEADTELLWQGSYTAHTHEVES